MAGWNISITNSAVGDLAKMHGILQFVEHNATRILNQSRIITEKTLLYIHSIHTKNYPPQSVECPFYRLF